MRQKTIVIIDEGTAGHKYAFAKLFSKHLLKLGHKVVLILPSKTQNIHEELTQEIGELTDFLFAYNLGVQTMKHQVHKRLNNVLNALSNWLNAKRIIKKVEGEHGHLVDLVFFSWLDSYVANYLPKEFIQYFFPYKWSGLYFHPWYLFQTDYSNVSLSSKDNVLFAKNCIGAGVHDHILATKLSNRIKKPVLYFPEIADASPPLKDYDLSNTLSNKSKGRPIVGLIGLSRRKGLLHLIDVIHVDAKKECFYFLAGGISSVEYSSSENEKIQSLLDNLPENVMYYPSSIPEGREINSVIASFDVLFLVYDNFKSSSNFLTKAAIFRKLVVGIDSYWIGDNIKKYKLGLTTDGSNPSETLSMIKDLSRNPESLKANWEAFLEVNGEQQLEFAFRTLLKPLKSNN